MHSCLGDAKLPLRAETKGLRFLETLATSDPTLDRLFSCLRNWTLVKFVFQNSSGVLGRKKLLCLGRGNTSHLGAHPASQIRQ